MGRGNGLSAEARLALSATFVGLWSTVLIRAALQHGAWAPWAIGLALWVTVLVHEVVRFRERRQVGADAERTDERLPLLRARAGEAAFFVQSFLLLLAALWAWAGEAQVRSRPAIS